MEKKSASSLVCPECGGKFATSDILDGDGVVKCLNCNEYFRTSEILRRSSEVEAEEIRSSAYRDVENERTKAYREAEHERTEAFRETEDAKRRIEKERLEYEYTKLKDRNRRERRESTQKVLKDTSPIILLLLLIGMIVLLWSGISRRNNSNPDAIRVGVSSEDLVGMNYYEVAEILQEQGFTNIKLHNEGWHLLKDKGEVKSVSIDGCDEFYSYSKFMPDDVIIIYYYKGSDSDSLPNNN